MTHFFKPTTTAAAALLGLGTVSASAAVFEVDNGGIDNGQTYVLTSVTDSVRGTIDAGDLINVTLTDIANVLRVNPSSAATVGTRSDVLEDLDIRSGTIAGGSNVVSMTVLFDAPVVNGDGEDLVIFDWGDFNDAFSITINGVTIARGEGSTLSPGSNPRVLNSNPLIPDPKTAQTQAVFDVIPTNLAEFETFTASTTASSLASVNATSLNLDAFGVALGDSVLSLSISNAAGLDVQGIFGLPVPEPASLTWLAVGILALGRRRRRA